MHSLDRRLADVVVVRHFLRLPDEVELESLEELVPRHRSDAHEKEDTVEHRHRQQLEQLGCGKREEHEGMNPQLAEALLDNTTWSLASPAVGIFRVDQLHLRLCQ